MNFRSFHRVYREQYNLNLKLALPVMLSQAGQIATQLADNIMVGRLGAVPLAAVSFGGTIYFIVFLFGLGFAMGLTPLVGHHFGRGDFRQSSIEFQNSMLLCTMAGIVTTALMLGLVPLMHHMGQDPGVVSMAIPYYKYLAWSMLPVMVFSCFRQFLEGVGNTRMAMHILLWSNVLNIILNYILIFGKLGAPRMGAAGAGLATLIARLLTPVAIVVYFRHKDSLRRYLLFFKGEFFSWRRLKDQFMIGLPISSQLAMETSLFSLGSIMVGWIGALQLAANQIAINVASMTFMIILGISSATTIRVSHEMGRGNLPGVLRSANAARHIALLYNFVMATLMVLFRKYIPMVFTDDPELIAAASRLLILTAIFQLSDGMQAVTLGILRGMKDVKATAVIACFSYVLVALPVGYCFAFPLGMGASGVWAGYVVGLTLAALLLTRRFNNRYELLRKNS